MFKPPLSIKMVAYTKHLKMQKTSEKQMGRGKDKFLIATIISLSFIVLSLSLMSAGWITPASGSVVGGATTFNITNSTAATYNCTIWASSPSTTNSTNVSLGTLTNESAIDFDINGSIEVKVETLEDSNDYSFYASCMDLTSTTNTSTVTLTVDNTIPETPSSLSPASNSKDSDGSVTFSGSVVDANTTGCTLYFVGRNPGSSSYAMTYSASSCTYSITTIPEETYVYYIQATDGTNTTNSAQTRFSVSLTDTSSAYLFDNQVAAEASEENKLKFLSITNPDGSVKGGFIAIVAIVVIIGVGIWVSKK